MSSSGSRRNVPAVDDGTSATPTLARLRQARNQQARAERWIRAGLPLVLVLVVVTTVRTHPAPGASGRDLAVSIALGGLVLGTLVAATSLRGPDARDRVALAVALLVASGGLLMWAQPAGSGSVGILLGALVVARRLRGQVAVAIPLTVFVAVAVADGITGEGPGVALLATLGGLVGMLALARRLGAANEQAERLLVELEASRETEAKAAGLAERQRLAREMHDVLAHSLSGLLLQLEGARMLALDQQVEPRLAAVIERAHHLARSGLDEARRAIGMLRDDELPGPDRLGELAARFEADSGVRCRFTETGEPRALGSQARLACYRVAQEALTNVVKHARADRVEVQLDYEATRVRLSIEDYSTEPSVPEDREPVGGRGGYGLAGMRERAELLGGSFVAGSTPHGYRVELEVPT